QAVFSNMADLRSFRIFCLLSQGMQLKDAEALIANIFKVNSTTATRLVAQAAARYAVQLETRMLAFAREVLDQAEYDTENEQQWKMRISTAALKDRFETILRQTASPGPSSSRLEGIFRYPDESYQALRT